MSPLTVTLLLVQVALATYVTVRSRKDIRAFLRFRELSQDHHEAMRHARRNESAGNTALADK